MINKKASLTTRKLVVLILVIVALVFLLLAIYSFNIDILEWLRNLPDYSYGGDRELPAPTLTDAQVQGVCPEGGIIGFIGNFEQQEGVTGQYIHFIIEVGGKKYDKATKLYWDGTEENAKIKLLQTDNIFNADWFTKDLEIAEVKDRLIIVKPDFLDLESEIYQRTRFTDMPDELKYVNKLNGSYTAFNNKLCRILEETKFKPAWSENKGGKLLDIRPEAVSRMGEKGEVQILLIPYVDIGGFEYFYLKERRGFIEMKGSVGASGFWKDRGELGRIYPDDSIWLNTNALTRIIPGWRKSSPGANIFSEEDFKMRENEYYPNFGGYYYKETNLRINYEDVKKHFE